MLSCTGGAHCPRGAPQPPVRQSHMPRAHPPLRPGCAAVSALPTSFEASPAQLPCRLAALSSKLGRAASLAERMAQVGGLRRQAPAAPRCCDIRTGSAPQSLLSVRLRGLQAVELRRCAAHVLQAHCQAANEGTRAAG